MENIMGTNKNHTETGDQQFQNDLVAPNLVNEGSEIAFRLSQVKEMVIANLWPDNTLSTRWIFSPPELNINTRAEITTYIKLVIINTSKRQKNLRHQFY